MSNSTVYNTKLGSVMIHVKGLKGAINGTFTKPMSSNEVSTLIGTLVNLGHEVRVTGTLLNSEHSKFQALSNVTTGAVTAVTEGGFKTENTDYVIANDT